MSELFVPFGVDEEDVEATLSAIQDERRIADEAEARLLLRVAHYADLHPIVGRIFIAAGMDGRERLVPLAGEGTPHVAEFAISDLAVALGLTTNAARALLGDVLELRHRLPLTWARVHDGSLQAWKARQIAQRSRGLSIEAAAWVDEQVAPVAHAISNSRLLDLMQAALLACEPARAEQERQQAADGQCVHVGRIDKQGMAVLTAYVDGPDGQALDAALNRGAAILKGLGDDRSHDVRRAATLGLLADPQAALDLLVGGADAVPARPPATLYVHVKADTVVSGHGVVRVEDLGPFIANTVADWLGDRELTVRPVIDLAARISVDSYESTGMLREQTYIKDPRCVFPWCDRRGRVQDHDHIEPYDAHGPPGQTNTHNLARLCRFHHRTKTHAAWTYRRLPDGGYLWTNGYGEEYLVDRTGTHPLMDAAS